MISPLVHARARAREERNSLGSTSKGLSVRLKERIWEQYEIEIVPADGESFLQGGRGEVVPAEGCLYYDRKLDGKPDELLEVIAHEYGHLVLHHEAFAPAGHDLLRGSAFLNSGAPSLSRYSPKSQREAEASAFAAELICPAGEIFERWKQDQTIAIGTLVDEFCATSSLVRLQLTEGLHELVAGVQQTHLKQKEESTTPEQEKAAIAFGIPVMLDAGPGTGKTRTLVRRIVHLVREQHVEPEQILVLTFSNEAAAELQERIRQSLGGEQASRLLASTFHGFGVILLNALGHHVGLNVDFSIVDEICQQELISELLGSVDCEALLDIRDPEQTAAEATRLINFLKDRLVGPEEFRAAIRAWIPAPDETDAYRRSEALLRLFEEYERSKLARQTVDFADLIRIPHQLLALRDDLRESIRADFPWVLVDEYQDVSRATALLLQQICGEKNPPWVVGDARQAIYRFRGAEPENVLKFEQDFRHSKKYQLSDNYRSAPEVIAVINHLAAWLDNPSHQSPVAERWRAGRSITSLGEQPVRLAVANCDAAEREGIIKTVVQWLAEGVAAEDIAVLARRNVDVRNVALELKKNGIRAVTSGLLTAEGGGGDLSAVLTAVDHKQAIARLAYALHRHEIAPAVLNEAIRQLLKSDIESAVSPIWEGPGQVQQVAADTWQILRELRRFIYSGDGWAILGEFLFFLTPYLRELITSKAGAESAVQLEEVLSGLSLAASYRFTHPHVQPRQSRLGLAERMRDLLTQAAPGLVPPRALTGAVHVMTCHASKGLEFPCVIVAGQSLPDIPEPKASLPPIFRPNPNLDAMQAESLLFVGVSRAQRSALVSYAKSASDRPRSRARRFPDLLSKLRESGVIPVTEWNKGAVDDEEIEIGRVWGGEAPAGVSTYSLGSNTCHIKTYLEEHLGARFRGRLRPLYPEFMQRVREVLCAVIEFALRNGRKPSDSETVQIVEEKWPPGLQKDHPHLSLYRPRALRWARALAQAFDPTNFVGATLREEPFEWTDDSGVSRIIKLQLIGHFNDANGDQFAVALQVDSDDESAAEVKWSQLKDYQRLPFVLLHQLHGGVQPRVFVGEKGELRSFRWSQRRPEESTRVQADAARQVFQHLTSGIFEGTTNDWACDRCPCRTICPGWIGAIQKDKVI
jgi:DNA helicase II / ATP-dependent DNA helicase PcrA